MLSRSVVLLMVAAISGPALAHGLLKRAEPRADAVLVDAPKRLLLEFSEALEPALVGLALSNGSQSLPLTGPPVVSSDGRTLEAGLNELPPGRYRVEWSVVAKDGHKTKGTYPFEVRPHP